MSLSLAFFYWLPAHPHTHWCIHVRQIGSCTNGMPTSSSVQHRIACLWASSKSPWPYSSETPQISRSGPRFASLHDVQEREKTWWSSCNVVTKVFRTVEDSTVFECQNPKFSCENCHKQSKQKQNSTLPLRKEEICDNYWNTKKVMSYFAQVDNSLNWLPYERGFAAQIVFCRPFVPSRCLSDFARLASHSQLVSPLKIAKHPP